MRRNKARPNDREIDAFGRHLVASVSQSWEGSPDPVFLAAFRRKFQQVRRFGKAAGPSLGSWCWKAAPLTALATVLLTFLLLFQVETTEPYPDASEQVLSTLVEQTESELSGDVILEAMLLQETER